MIEKKFKDYTILYAEDDNNMRINYSNYLETLFASVYEARDGLEALSLYKKHLPDILLLDISMPHMDGLTLAHTIRKHDEDVKIILLTAHGDQEKLLSAVKLNLIDYLLKPIKRSSLLEALTKAVKSSERGHIIKKPIVINKSYLWYQDILELYDNDGNIVHLTNKEKTLLSLLTSYSSASYSIDMIIDHYSLNEFQMSANAVRAIIKRIKTKLPKDSLINNFGVGYKIIYS
jgi:DNA-binding response OmpR family regulator